MAILVVLFAVLFALFPYLLTFFLLMLPRLVPPVRRIPRKIFAGAAAGCAVAGNLIATLVSGRNPLNYTYACFGETVYAFGMLLPLFLAGGAAALAVNGIPLLSGKEPRLSFRPVRTTLAAVLTPLLLLGGIAVHCVSMEVDVPPEYAAYVEEAELASAKKTFLGYGISNFTFPFSMEVTAADENGFCAEAVYYVRGRDLGISPDGLYHP